MKVKPAPGLLSIDEAAADRKVCRHTILRWAREGVEGVKLRLQLGTDIRRRYVDPADLQEFMRQVAKRKGLR